MLALQAAGVAGQLTVAPDHTVARNDDAQRIAADGLADLLCRRPVGEGVSEFSVCDSAAVGNRGEHCPDAPLPLVSVWVRGDVELGAVTCEVVGELGARLGQHDVGVRVDPRAEGALMRPMPVVPEVDAGECVVVGDHGEFAQCAVDDAVSGVHIL
jgi:hypothetical protein